jgi:YVTN family beta-propeller protein
MRLRLLLALFLLSISTAAFGASGYQLVKKILLGGEGGWDYLTFDPGSGRLFISRATHVTVLDAASGKVVGDIPDTAGVHGIALAPELGRGFTSNGRADTVTIFDLKTLATIGQVKTGQNPDAIVYDPASKRVFTMNGRSGDATAIDAATGKVEGTVPLGGKPEFAVTDGGGHIYINIEDKSELVALDSRKLEVGARWPLAPCERPTGLAMDREHQRLFSGCSNELMAVVDADSGKVIATLPIGSGVDATAFDPGLQYAYASNGQGTLTVVHEDSPGKFSVVENVATQRGARTMALDPDTHRVYLVTADFAPAPPPAPGQPRPRPAILPNTFVLMVVGR